MISGKGGHFMKLFVPGRLCLFGEHSDWAGGYRRIDEAIEPGYCLISGTNQGIYADTEPDNGYFEMSSILPDSQHAGPFRIAMNQEALDRAARAGGFESYAAGVASEVSLRHRVSGLRVKTERMDLPLKKGLSSSAAICVLIARAFNMIYELKLDIRTEMEMAYLGEIRTGSACGRMDQSCAYGVVPTLLTFDADRMDVEVLDTKRELLLLIVDLKGAKDTRKILSDLNAAFRMPESDAGRNIRQALGVINAAIVKSARQAIIEGNAMAIGALMTEAQADFDRFVRPICPSELDSPKLHAILEDSHMRELSEGGKGVGSQGDGCAQFIFSDPEKRKAASQYLFDYYGMESFELTIP
jgi:galactokinase